MMSLEVEVDRIELQLMQQNVQRARLTEVVNFLEKATSGRPVSIDPVDRITGRKPN